MKVILLEPIKRDKKPDVPIGTIKEVTREKAIAMIKAREAEAENPNDLKGVKFEQPEEEEQPKKASTAKKK